MIDARLLTQLFLVALEMSIVMASLALCIQRRRPKWRHEVSSANDLRHLH